jgi:nicotinamidase-related amidase
MLERDRVLLLVVDVQEGFRPAVEGFAELAASAAILVRAATVLRVPVIVTEQYPRGLGPTSAELAPFLDGVVKLEKVVFSATEADGFDLGGRDQVLICGVEAHVCVYQTAARLRRFGTDVSVVSDAVSSRTPENRAAGLLAMRERGVTTTTVETALFEILGGAGNPDFKAVQALIK